MIASFPHAGGSTYITAVGFKGNIYCFKVHREPQCTKSSDPLCTSCLCQDGHSLGQFCEISFRSELANSLQIWKTIFMAIGLIRKTKFGINRTAIETIQDYQKHSYDIKRFMSILLSVIVKMSFWIWFALRGCMILVTRWASVCCFFYAKVNNGTQPTRLSGRQSEISVMKIFWNMYI